MTFMINTFGPFYLTYKLFDMLSLVNEARIINVASLAHTFTDKYLMNDLGMEKDYHYR